VPALGLGNHLAVSGSLAFYIQVFGDHTIYVSFAGLGWYFNFGITFDVFGTFISK
jgi:hypothetical protein